MADLTRLRELHAKLEELKAQAQRLHDQFMHANNLAQMAQYEMQCEFDRLIAEAEARPESRH